MRPHTLMALDTQAALEFFEGQAMQAGATPDATPAMDMHVSQVREVNCCG